jgi:hypothetical protein
MLFRRQELGDLNEFLSFIDKDDLVAIKLHVGEHGNVNHLDATIANELAEKCPGKVFFTDCSTYYTKKRHNAVEHMLLAKEHGFTSVPFIQSDGLGKTDGIELESKGILDKTYIAPIYAEVDKVIILTHATGHVMTGYGGAIKNIGMGCATKRGKLEQHRLVDIKIDGCIGCGKCVKVCPYDAVVFENRIRTGQNENCMRCPACERECPANAIKLYNKDKLCRALASVTWSFLNLVGKENVKFITVANKITERCDCSTTSVVVEEDKGLFFSDNVVEIEKAVLNTLTTNFKAKHGVDPWVQIVEAERLGL